MSTAEITGMPSGVEFDQPAPHVRDLETLERRIVLAEPRQAELHQLRVGAGIERAMALERRGLVERPARQLLRPVEERAADREAEAPASLLEGRPEVAGVHQALRRQLDQAAAAQPDRIAAVEPAADRDVGHRQAALRDTSGAACGRERGRLHAGLRQPQPMAAAEQPAPRAAGQQHGLRADRRPSR